MLTGALHGLASASRGMDLAAARIAAGSVARPAEPVGPAEPIGRDVVELRLYERQFQASAKVIARTERAISSLLDVIV